MLGHPTHTYEVKYLISLTESILPGSQNRITFITADSSQEADRVFQSEYAGSYLAITSIKRID